MGKEEILKIKINSKKFKIKNCKGIKSAKGLMFSKLKNIDGALIYTNNVWMPFTRHDLDLFFLDQNLKIIDCQKAEPISSNPKSWKVYKNKKATFCLELKHKSIKKPEKLIGNKVKIIS